MKKNNLKLSVLITTMNWWIQRVKNELLPQLKEVDEIIISHQITVKSIIPENNILWKNIKYYYMNEKGLSKNRNNALKQATWDICHICDDDLHYIAWFIDIIKWEYMSSDSDIITFQAENEIWRKHFWVKEWKHNFITILKLSSIWITFKRESLCENNIVFNEKFWLWSKYPVGEENIFLSDSMNKWLKLSHCNKSIVIHPDESSWIDYRKELIIARIKVFKKLFWFLWGLLWVFYFTILHYKYYNDKFGIYDFFILSCQALKDK